MWRVNECRAQTINANEEEEPDGAERHLARMNRMNIESNLNNKYNVASFFFLLLALLFWCTQFISP
jgi:hypothetical protein